MYHTLLILVNLLNVYQILKFHGDAQQVKVFDDDEVLNEIAISLSNK